MSQPPRLLPSAYCSAATGRPKHDRCGHHLASSEEKKDVTGKAVTKQNEGVTIEYGGVIRFEV